MGSSLTADIHICVSKLLHGREMDKKTAVTTPDYGSRHCRPIYIFVFQNYSTVVGWIKKQQ